MNEISFKDLRTDLSNNKIREVLKKLQSYLEVSEEVELSNTIILLVSKLNFLQQSKIRGTEENTFLLKETGKLIQNILEILDVVEKNDKENKYKSKKETKIYPELLEFNLVIERSIQTYEVNDQKKLLNAIDNLLQLGVQVKITNIKVGSLVITLLIPKFAVEFLKFKINNGELNKYNVRNGYRPVNSHNPILVSIYSNNENFDSKIIGIFLQLTIDLGLSEGSVKFVNKNKEISIPALAKEYQNSSSLIQFFEHDLENYEEIYQAEFLTMKTLNKPCVRIMSNSNSKIFENDFSKFDKDVLPYEINFSREDETVIGECKDLLNTLIERVETDELNILHKFIVGKYRSQ